MRKGHVWIINKSKRIRGVLEVLGIRDGEPWVVDHNAPNNTISHEICSSNHYI